jgi:membrane carboxypeptidase/penicillin-binding protein
LLEVKNSRGELLYRNECALDGTHCWEGEPIISPLVTYQITDILSDNKARTPAFGPNSVLFIPNQQVAVKTGTTNSMRDNWAMGYTTDRLVAVWVGNNDNTPMSYVASGITGASPIWNKIMRSLLDEKNPHQFALPPDLIKVAICAKTGTLPCSGCPNVREEIFVVGTQPVKACNSNYFTQTPGAPISVLPQPVVVTADAKFKRANDVAVRKPVVRN